MGVYVCVCVCFMQYLKRDMHLLDLFTILYVCVCWIMKDHCIMIFILDVSGKHGELHID